MDGLIRVEGFEDGPARADGGSNRMESSNAALEKRFNGLAPDRKGSG
jgi:hypothetical protein